MEDKRIARNVEDTNYEFAKFMNRIGLIVTYVVVSCIAAMITIGMLMLVKNVFMFCIN